MSWDWERDPRYRSGRTGDGTDGGRPRRRQLAPGKRTLTMRLPARVQRAALTEPGPDPDGALALARESYGAPLPAPLAGRLASATGESMDQVRVHDDRAAHAASRALGARAFTAGNDIFFASGNYDPGSRDGQQLIAHEAAHTVQQRGSEGLQQKPQVSRPGDVWERDADFFAEAFMNGHEALLSRGAAGTIQRDADPSAGERTSGASRTDVSVSADADAIVARPPSQQPPGATIRYKGGRAVDGVRPHVEIDPQLLPDLKDLWEKLEELRTLSVPLAGEALVSVADHPEMRRMRSYSSREGDIVEFPASFRQNPPTEEVAALIAVNEAIDILEHWTQLKETHVDDDQLRLDEIGGMPIQGTREGIERYRQQLIVTKTLQALSGTFGGMIGLQVGQLLSDDPLVVAEAGVLGETVTGMLGGQQVFGRRKGETGTKGRPPKSSDGGRRRRRRQEARNPEHEPRFGDEVTGGDSRKLRGNMNEAWGFRRALRWIGRQAHHIIPSALLRHPVIRKIGMQLDHPSNGISLRLPEKHADSPDDGGSQNLPQERSKLPSHHRTYHGGYNKAVERKLDEMDLHASVDSLRAQVTTLQNKARHLIEQGTPLYPSGGQKPADIADLWYRLLSK